MPKITIDLPATIGVSKSGRDWGGKTATVSVDVAKINASVLANIFNYGLTQKVADSASGAESPTDATTKMTACADNLYAGEWRTGGGGSVLSTGERATRDVLTDLLVKLRMKRGEAVKMARDRKAAEAWIVEKGGFDAKALTDRIDATIKRRVAAMETPDLDDLLGDKDE